MKELVAIGTEKINANGAYIISGTFAPEEDGYYRIKTTKWRNDVDTCVTLFDSDGNEIDNDDDGGEDNNFLLLSKLEAGPTHMKSVRTIQGRVQSRSTCILIKLLCIPSVICSLCSEKM